ncbi:hypothetical protein GCM10023085_13590 [Actinomadura viridis]|uniref:Mce-associated membrane protein n=1 Tax=Actinomadura viridis TaxID=58110 RepID=A0A931DS27_9ACTN|nr:hypothetical protein [Actinomadura viridis]MBG6093733.1 hypothetical protein [Actinomadura viridis]
MTGKTTKDVPEDAADVDAVEPAEAADAPAEDNGTGGAGAARPARRKRRVRVIEVIEDDDLDEVLDALDAEDAAAEEAAGKGTGRAAGSAGSAKAATPAPSARAAKPARTVPAEAEDEDGDGDGEEIARTTRPAADARGAKARPAPVSLDGPSSRTFLGLGTTQAIVVVLLVAVLASLALWQWRTAAGLSGEEKERKAVSKVASDYGDLALNYNASNYQEQMRKAQALMGGDMLESFKSDTLPNLGNTFKQNPQLVLTSKTDQVFVGGIDGRFATATISVDVSLRTPEGTHDAPATLIRLAIAKIDGRWKITKMYASGVNDQNQRQGSGLPTVPTSPAPSGQPKDTKDQKQKD